MEHNKNRPTNFNNKGTHHIQKKKLRCVRISRALYNSSDVDVNQCCDTRKMNKIEDDEEKQPTLKPVPPPHPPKPENKIRCCTLYRRYISAYRGQKRSCSASDNIWIHITIYIPVYQSSPPIFVVMAERSLPYSRYQMPPRNKLLFPCLAYPSSALSPKKPSPSLYPHREERNNEEIQTAYPPRSPALHTYECAI